ncbi:alpha-2-macroglobulin [Treponema sp. C6A8]|uniref:alpha-2-macroglobulin family protein n=1 Tax=Treponema sp. C6A8 TaxID=1410609 RepID=UPI00048953F8|nr:alpha-2-macroglobulin family protein [Treponema sp. C6A8]
MKKSGIFIFLCILALLFAGCKNKSAVKSEDTAAVNPSEKAGPVKKARVSAGFAGTPFNAESYSEEKPVYKERASLHLSTDSSNLVDYDSVSQFFTLDYTPEYPDSVFAGNDDGQAGTGKNGKNNPADKNDKSESFIPGIRKLSDYLTKYVTKKSTLQNYKPADEPEEDDSTKEFFVEDWGPQGKIVAGENHPSFYVIFSRPARSLQAVDKPQTSSDIMSIEPPLPGVFRWYGTKHLSFESDLPADPTVQYTIKIKPGLKSAGGKKLTGETEFRTTAEAIEVINIWGGYVKDSDCAHGWDTGALPPYENRFVMRTNYTTTVSAVRHGLKVFVSGETVQYDIEAVYKDIFHMWANHAEFDEDAGRSNTFLVKIKDNVPHNARVEVSNSNGKAKGYDTLLPFKVTRVAELTEYSSVKIAWPLRLTFSQIPDKQSLVENLTWDDGKKLTEKNIIVNGRTVKLCNLPFDYNQNHKLTINAGLKDKYGQMLASSTRSYDFKTPKEKSYVRFQNHGTTMLEAQFPHKMIFEYQNLLDGNYQLQKTDRPSGNGVYGFNNTISSIGNLDLESRNQRIFQELELDPFLDDGYGFVRFEGNAKYLEYNYWREKYEEEMTSMSGVVQVTDLGITARMSINKAVVMVRSLSSGKPVENAEVYIVHDLNDYLDHIGKSEYPKEIFVYGNAGTYDKLYAKGRTDKNGLAVINYSEEEIEKITAEGRDAFVYVVNGKDRAAFAPSSHNSWRDGVTTAGIGRARTPEQRTFMFVDRGIYRPGEIVTFRGIDRDQLLGTFTPHKGEYAISARGTSWKSKDIITPIKGQLSESGGFYGSFKIPDDVERGYYNLIYSRDGKSNQSELISFVIADFERVKFESSITVPQVSYFGGDKVSATLSADYLAGGSLSGAQYEVSWYKSPTTFKTSEPAAKGYSFYTGIYPDRNYYSNDEGVLGLDGTAAISCSTEKITDGTPYIYHVESAVTDVSNQRIAASNDIFVHPAQFYVGIAKARNTRGFAKAGEKLEIPYILVNPDGKIMPEGEVAIKVSGLEYSLSHEVWTMVHEQSVDDTIYTRYERSDVEDVSGDLKALANGILPLTPKSSGWYTLKITGKDSRGNKVICKSEFYVTGSGSSWFDQYNSNSLKLTPDKSQYNPGETARVLLESPLPAGDYLITVEREGIFTEEIRHFENGAEVLEIPVAGNYVPVVYVSVSSYSERQGPPVHKYGEPDLDKPKGYYGVTPLLINPYVRSFTVKVECDKPSYKPGDTATIKFTATKGGKPYAGAELTAMAVDRGVLDLINYHVPNPIDFFYSKSNFPLRVYGGDSRALLMDPVTYSVKDLKGGDSDEEKEDERKDFRPTAFFEPVMITDENGQATVTFKLPDSLTTYRITAFGVKDDLFALQEEEVKVQNPINIQQVQPRRLRERDTAECGVLISNLGKDGQKVTVSLEVQSPTKDTEQDKLEGRKTIPGKGFVDGESSHTVYVASGQSTVVYFDVAAQKEGTVNLVYKIKSDLLNERLVSPIRIEKTFVYETVTMTGTISDEKSGSEKESVIIPGFAKEGRGDFSFTLDATRLGLLGSSVNYLFDYPYGCLEQQGSRILPLVSFGDYIDIFGMDSKIQDIKTCVTKWTSKWKDYQHSDGGFGYWPESIYSSDFVSMRILYIYALAMQRGYSPDDIPINVASLKRYLVSAVKNYSKRLTNSNYYDFDKAFACYVFSLVKDTSLNSIRDELYSRIDDLPLDAAAYLSLAYGNSDKESDKEKVKIINGKIRPYLQPDQRGVTLSKKARSGYWFFYQNEDLKYAAILTAFVSENPDDGMVDRLIYTLLRKQSHGYWQNTSTTASVLESIYTYIKKRNLDATDYTATASLSGRQLMKESFKGVASKPKTLKLPFEDEFIASLPRDKAIPLVFEKEGDGYLFYTVEMKYALPDEAQAARDEGLNITYEITDFDTGELINVTKDTCDLKLESGKIYKAKVFIQTNRTREYVAVRAPIPSGAEILDSTLVTSGSAAQSSNSQSWRSIMSHKNITDNEAQFFWDEMRSGRYFFDFTFRAVRRGIYPTPPVQAECMYEPEVFGRSDGYLFVIE